MAQRSFEIGVRVVTGDGLVALLVAVVLVAAYLPARRAMSIEPVVALRRQ